MLDQRKYEFDDNVYLYNFCQIWNKTAKPIIESFLHCSLLAQQQKDDDGFHSCSSSKDLELWDVKLLKLFAMLLARLARSMIIWRLNTGICIVYIQTISTFYRKFSGGEMVMMIYIQVAHCFQGLIDAFDAIFLSTSHVKVFENMSITSPRNIPTSQVVLHRQKEAGRHLRFWCTSIE